MATREELAMNSELKEINKIKEWFEKNELQLNKWVEMVQKQNYLTDFGKYKNIWLKSRDTYTWKMRNEDSDTAMLLDYVKSELDRALKDSKENPKIQKIADKIYSIWSKIDSMNDNYSKLNNTNTRYITAKKSYSEKQDSKSPQQIKDEEHLEKMKELKRYIKNELPNINIPSLDKWLEEYKEIYLNWVDELLAKEELSSWKASSMKKNVNEVLEEQKLSIILRSWEKVGRIRELKIARLGSDGSFNGVVVGERGTINIQTILAGGYNVQVLHYRVLTGNLKNDNYDEYKKLMEKFGLNILESNKSYIKDITIFNNLEDRIIKINAKDFLQKYTSIHFDKLNSRKESKIIVISSFASLTKKEKIKFSQKIKGIYDIENREFMLVVLNSSNNSIVNFNSQLAGRVTKIN